MRSISCAAIASASAETLPVAASVADASIIRPLAPVFGLARLAICFVAFLLNTPGSGLVTGISGTKDPPWNKGIISGRGYCLIVMTGLGPASHVFADGTK
jgi:hypothetical protein